jgi:RimJ/RimL family protein N-acetyltransferase
MTTHKTDPILIDVPMPVETPRLVLRPVGAGDGAAMHEAKRESWDLLGRWMIWTRGGPGAPEADERSVREGAAKFLLREDLWLVGIEKQSARPVIWTGLHKPDWEARRFEIGYWVRAGAQGNGYAAEATNALVRYAFAALGAKRVEITHAAGNEASRRTIARLGFTQEGTKARHSLLPDGSLVDQLFYARLDAAGLPELDVKWGPP